MKSVQRKEGGLQKFVSSSVKKKKANNEFEFLQTVPLQQSLQQFQDNSNQTVEIHFTENGTISTLQLKGSGKTSSHKNLQKIARTKIIPMPMLL